MTDAAHIRSCVERLTDALARKPPAPHKDAPARAVWDGGLGARLVIDQTQDMRTDMPAAVGGADQAPSPGWYFRAGAAACLLSTIALNAAVRNIALRRLEVEANSETDPRGMLGCAEGVPAGAQRFWLDVTIEADGVDGEVLQELVAYADAHAPMSGALRRPLQVQTQIRAGDATS